MITDKFSLLKQWKTHLSQLGTKIKVGDIALLIEIMRYYPESVTKQEIIKNIAFSPKSTLYRRLSVLEKLELAIDTNQISIDEDFRYKNLKISQLGIDFLKSLYSALKQEIG